MVLLRKFDTIIVLMNQESLHQRKDKVYISPYIPSYSSDPLRLTMVRERRFGGRIVIPPDDCSQGNLSWLPNHVDVVQSQLYVGSRGK